MFSGLKLWTRNISEKICLTRASILKMEGNFFCCFSSFASILLRYAGHLMYCHPSFRLLSPSFTLVSECDLSFRPLIAFSSAVIISCSRWALMTTLTCWDGLVVSQGASVVSFSVISAFGSQITWLQCLIRVKDEVSLRRRTVELLLRPLSPAGRKMVNFV